MKKLLFFCAAITASIISTNCHADLSDYAIDKRKIFNDFIFLPIKGSERQGSFLYTQYKKSILPPSTTTVTTITSRSVTLVLSPTAVGSTAHNQFILNNNILDNRRNLIPADASLCVLTNDAKRKITELGLTYTTSLLVGGYPKACSLIIRYFAIPQSTQEKSLLDYLAANNVISLSYNIEEIVSPAVTISFHDILDELYVKGALTKDDSNIYQGPLSGVTYNAALLSPTLFGELSGAVFSLTAWEVFLNAFILSGKTLKVQLTNSNQILYVPAIQEEIVNVANTL